MTARPPLFPHQREAMSRMRGHESFALFLEQGLGKTRIILEEFETGILYWKSTRRKGAAPALLVVAPNGVHLNWSRVEIPAFEPIDDWHVVEWSSLRSSSQRWIDNFERRIAEQEKPFVFVVNVEALSTPKSRAAERVRQVCDRRPTTFVVDESSRIKTPGSTRTKRVIQLGKGASCRRILTGTPVTQSPFDLYAQFRFLDPDLLGFPSYYGFRNRYGKFQPRTVSQHGRLRTFQELVEYVRLDELTKRIAPFSYRRTRDECIDLPPKIYQRLVVELTPQQRRIYDALDKEGIVELDDLELLAPLAITRLLRCQQVTGGFIGRGMTDDAAPGDDRGAVAIPGPNPKLAALLESIDEDPERKTVVWARFRGEIAAIVFALREAYGRGAVEELHGGVTGADRAEVVRKFQEGRGDSDARFIVGQQQAGIGITLTAARRVYYYSNTFSYEQRYQTEDRCHRIGTTRSVVYIDIVAVDTVDEQIAAALRRYRHVADRVTGDSKRKGTRDENKNVVRDRAHRRS